MVKNERKSRAATFRPESLEGRNLLSLLLGSKPTLDVKDGPGVHHNRDGTISIVQPAVLQVFGTAQTSDGVAAQVSIYAEDSEGNLVNGGVPLATVVPDFLGRYNALVSLPSRLRADVNVLVARETASATLSIPIGLSGSVNNLTGPLAIDPGTFSGLSASVANPPTSLSSLSGTVSTPANMLTNLGGSITTPATPISNIAGTITTPAFPLSTGGTAGPAVSTLLGGSGTLNAQVGTLTGASGAIGATDAALTTAPGTIAGTTSILTQTGTAAESGRTGALNGASGTTTAAGTGTLALTDAAESDPLTILIHQPRSFAAPVPARVAPSATHAVNAGLAHALAVQRARVIQHARVVKHR
jgi:hypothetical protein